ncbi:MAG: MFS transporter [Ilumatobacteraceae bacterium]
MRDGPTSRFPGWRVVAACFICLMTTSGLGFYGLAVYLTVLSRERGWSVGSISAAGAVFFLVGGLAGVIVARQIARRDVRVVIVVGAVVGAVALVMLGRISQVWHVYLAYIVLSIGHAFSGLVPATTVVTRWFHTRRSVALAVASTGLSAGGIVVTPLVKFFLDRNGLAATAPWLAVVWLIGIVPITLLFIRPDPASLGWQPDGLKASSATRQPMFSTGRSDAIRSRFFLLVTIAYTFIFAAQIGAIQQLVKLVEERHGMSIATLSTTVLAGSSVLARLAGGHLASQLSMAKLAVGCAALQGCSLILLAFVESLASMMIGIVLFGATIGNLLMLHPLLIGQEFGSENYAQIFSRSQLFVFIGAAAGPFLVGVIHDATGGYLAAYLLAGGFSLAGAAILPRFVRRDIA